MTATPQGRVDIGITGSHGVDRCVFVREEVYAMADLAYCALLIAGFLTLALVLRGVAHL